MCVHTNKSVELWDKINATPTGQRFWPSEELVRAVSRRERVGPLGRVLEVGCGNGANLWYLAEHAVSVDGLDSSDVALALARGYFGMRRIQSGAALTLTRGDATEPLPYPSESFDSVIDCMVSQHLPWVAHAALYREYARVLRPGGWLFLYHLDADTMSVRGPWLGGFDYSALGLFAGIPLFCLPPRQALVSALTHAGFLMPNVNGLKREYDNGDVASYAVLDAEAGA